jgi:3-methyladenine DNA glycosylase AlkD
MHAVVSQIVKAFAPLADETRAAPMAKYMRDQFPFLGITAPQRDTLLKPIIKGWKPADQSELSEVALLLWAYPEREYQYAASRIVTKYAGKVEPIILATIVKCAQDRSWWDTVDELARAVGSVVFAHPHTVKTVEPWVTNEDFWLARLAILHQLGYGTDTDLDRLSRLCLARAHDPEFFIRKGIGWALRDASYTHPQWVGLFIESHADQLSPLTRKEGMKAIERANGKAVSLDQPILRKAGPL